MTPVVSDRRVLGAVRFVDAVTGQPVEEALDVRADGVRWVRTHRALWVLLLAPGLDAHAAAFPAPPAVPAPGTVPLGLVVRDPARRFLARRARVALPRDPDPAHAARADSLFRPVDVALYPAPASPVARGWALVRATVEGMAPLRGLAGALVRVVRESDGVRVGGGMTDARGEALVAVQGIPGATFGDDDGPVLATEVAVRLEVVWDPDAADPPDPDQLEARRAELLVRQQATTLASGRVRAMRL